MKILIIENSELSVCSLSKSLNCLGIVVESVLDSSVGYRMACHYHYDVILLELAAEPLNGLFFIKQLRGRRIMTRILVMSSVDSVKERVDALLQGADDFVMKPFNFDELHARIIAMTRRNEPIKEQNYLCIGDFFLNLFDRTFYYQNQQIKLTPREFNIVEYLFRNPNRTLSYEKISDTIAGDYSFLSKNNIEVHMSSIRRKVKSLNAELPILTKKGFGYSAQTKAV